MSEEFEVSFDAIVKKIDSADLYLPRPEFKKRLASYRYFRLFSSVADPGCLSRILIFTHPGSRIPDPKTATKERDEKNLLSYLFFEPLISQN
jgi:hypothetical protein